MTFISIVSLVIGLTLLSFGICCYCSTSCSRSLTASAIFGACGFMLEAEPGSIATILGILCFAGSLAVDERID